MNFLEKRVKGLSIRGKLILVIMGVSVIVLMLSSAVMMAQVVREEKKSIVDAMVLTARIIGNNSVTSLVSGDKDTVSESLLALFANKIIRKGCLYDKDLRLFAEYALSKQGEQGCGAEFTTDLMPDGANTRPLRVFLESLGETTHAFYPDRLVVLHPIEAEGEKAGFLYIVADLTSVNAFMKRQMLVTAAIVLLTVFLIYFLTSWIQRIISGPAISLTRVAREVSLTRNYSLRAEKETDDEFGVLTDSFNEMMAVIRQREAELKKSETEALAAKKDAEKANSAKTDFLANMSHELRTPMNSILGLTKMLLQEENPGQEWKEMLGVIHMASSSMLEIVNDILDLSKIEAQGIVLERRAFDFRALSKRILEPLAPLASEKGLSLRHSWRNGAPAYLVGDSARLGRVLTNIIGNAIKYTSQGSVDVTFGFPPLPGGGTLLECVVTDTGIGIPEDKVDYIFEKFTQADETINRKFGGTGLGLAISRQIVGLMGGTISVASAVGKGSTFTIVLPFETALRMETEEEYPSRPERAARQEKNRKPLGQARLLVAEDHALNQVFIRKLLRRWGVAEPDLAHNGQEAVGMERARQYDLILMDCHMPEKSGYEAAREIRLMAGRETTPIIAMTADVMAGVREKCREAGMDEYISKPIDEGILRSVLDRWFIMPDKGALHATGAAGIETPMKEESGGGVLDRSLLRQFSEGDAEVEKELLRVFLAQSEETMAILSANRSDGENEAWSEAAHKFKGGAAVLGAERLHVLCAQAQDMKAASAAERSVMFGKIQAAYDAVKKALGENH